VLKRPAVVFILDWNMYEGTVNKVVVDRGFGFIASAGQADAFFHMDDLPDDLEFNEQLCERRVTFDLVANRGRFRAANIRVAE
jgi:cold shock CspA family protein